MTSLFQMIQCVSIQWYPPWCSPAAREIDIISEMLLLSHPKAPSCVWSHTIYLTLIMGGGLCRGNGHWFIFPLLEEAMSASPSFCENRGLRALCLLFLSSPGDWMLCPRSAEAFSFNNACTHRNGYCFQCATLSWWMKRALASYMKCSEKEERNW